MVGRLRLWVVAAVVLGGLAAGSFAVAGGFKDGPKPPKVPDSKEFRAHLSGYQETPSVSSTGFGEFQAKLVEEKKLHFVFQYQDLEGGTSIQAHIHFGQRGVAGGVVVFFCGGGTRPTPCPNVSGTIEGDMVPSDLTGSTGATNQGIEPGSWDEFIAAMRTGHAYANIHTTRWPAGEIRGQINANKDKIK
jgi:CHRD domain-containing protein